MEYQLLVAIPTRQLAEFLGVKPHTVQRAYCKQGHYLGLKPSKLPNGRLLWPYEEALRLVDNPMNNICLL
jgi:predicted site-specific integrase-resolvase